MEWNVDETHTLYAVFLTLEQEQEIQIGALGKYHFPKGEYIYIGSAKKNIIQRTRRHCKVDKIKRWHLDYLRPYATVTRVQSYVHNKGECSLSADFAKQGKVFIKRFGASDCRCEGHLILLN